ncbi:MAG: helix-turn-helix domain-containing protein [Caulobacterales bacterium]|nr:helix-turn-helix domain-containing protein [Caulobacterales bacterium]
MSATLKLAPPDERLGARIRAARLRARLSQTALGARVGVSQPTVAHWEKGAHAPKPSHMRAVAEILSAPELAPEGEARPPRAPARAGRAEYLARAIRHVPILDWPAPGADFDPAAAPARDHVAASLEAGTPFALRCLDAAMARAFPPSSVVIFDGADRSLAEDAYHLVHVGGRYLVRRWRANPDRLEAAGEGAVADTIFPKTPPAAFGRALLAYRVLDGSAPVDR